MSSKIIGIDPGTNHLGWGVIEIEDKRFTYSDCGVFHLPPKADPLHKLKLIYDQIADLCGKVKPSALAVESQFQGKNVQSMLKLGRAQGVVIAAALNCGVAVWEYAPRRIKQAVTGNGGAGKEQVAHMLRHLLHLPDEKLPMDATDALATALCHHLSGGHAPEIVQKRKKSAGNWESFIRGNPDRAI